LNITCENEGCTAVVKLDALPNHLVECDFNPKKLVECENGCGLMISKDNVTVKSFLA
jgi:E3 ubiquitin-protein ligase NRDP1